MTIEIITGVLVGILAVVSVAAALIGLAGMFGLVRTSRCPGCGRFGVTVIDSAAANCLNCRHERMLHPVAVLHRTHAHGMHGHAA